MLVKDIAKAFGFRKTRLTVEELSKKLRKKGFNVNVIHVPHNQTYYYTVTGSYYEGNEGLLVNGRYDKQFTYEKALKKGLEKLLLWKKENLKNSLSQKDTHISSTSKDGDGVD